jgi:hypothetical protein
MRLTFAEVEIAKNADGKPAIGIEPNAGVIWDVTNG